MYSKIIKQLILSQKRGGDDFDVVDRASLRSMYPRWEVKQIYDGLKQEQIRRIKKAS
tara:strand:- start:13 stop:183 length:171 start_codon:yes stop_codon:yes gene_type:complete